MAETSLDEKIAELSKRIQDQARFTRAIVLVCAAAMIGALFFSTVQIFSLLPTAVVLQYMDKMPEIVAQWKVTEVTKARAKTLPEQNAPAPSK